MQKQADMIPGKVMVAYLVCLALTLSASWAVFIGLFVDSNR